MGPRAGTGVPEPREPPGTWRPAASGGAEAGGEGDAGPAAPRAGCAEMSRGEGGDGMAAAAGGPPSPRTILIQMCCPLKGTAVSRLRECHCRFLLPGGPRRLPARGGQAGQASAARARPGPRAAWWAPPANKRAAQQDGHPTPAWLGGRGGAAAPLLAPSGDAPWQRHWHGSATRSSSRHSHGDASWARSS